MRMFLYRTQANDSDGDPLDFGAVRAKDDKKAAEFVNKRLDELFALDGDPLPFTLYPLDDDGKPGVLKDLEAKAPKPKR